MYLVTQEVVTQVSQESMVVVLESVSEGVTVGVLSQGWLLVEMLVVLGGLVEVGSQWKGC